MVKTNGALLASILLLFKFLGLLLTVCAVILFNYLTFEKIACPNRGVGLFNSRISASQAYVTCVSQFFKGSLILDKYTVKDRPTVSISQVIAVYDRYL